MTWPSGRPLQRIALVTDVRGSVRLAVDVETGAVLQRITYDPFGVELSRSGVEPWLQPLGFAGGLTDAATGLVRFGARDYDAHTGRWTATDPIGFAGGDTNLYGYVVNDPVNRVDPSGLWDLEGDWTDVFYVLPMTAPWALLTLPTGCTSDDRRAIERWIEGEEEPRRVEVGEQGSFDLPDEANCSVINDPHGTLGGSGVYCVYHCAMGDGPVREIRLAIQNATVEAEGNRDFGGCVANRLGSTTLLRLRRLMRDGEAIENP